MCVCHDSLACVKWCIHMCVVMHSHSHMAHMWGTWHTCECVPPNNVSMCVSWCIRLCFVMCPYVCRNVSICVCAMTHLHVWNDVLICVSWCIHIVLWHTCESHGTHVNVSRQIMYPYVCRDVSICVPWLTCMCAVKYPYVCRNAFT